MGFCFREALLVLFFLIQPQWCFHTPYFTIILALCGLSLASLMTNAEPPPPIETSKKNNVLYPELLLRFTLLFARNLKAAFEKQFLKILSLKGGSLASAQQICAPGGELSHASKCMNPAK